MLKLDCFQERMAARYDGNPDDFVGHDNVSGHYPFMEYALFWGVSICDDSFIVQLNPRHWYHVDMSQSFCLVILERTHYGEGVAHMSWNKELLLQFVEDYHAYYMLIYWWPDIFLEKNRDIIVKINFRVHLNLVFL